MGRIDETAKCALLRRAWATVFASPKEGWGITNLEAAASGTPVIASNSPGIRESVKHDETGFLVPHGDVAAMAACMRRLFCRPMPMPGCLALMPRLHWRCLVYTA